MMHAKINLHALEDPRFRSSDAMPVCMVSPEDVMLVICNDVIKHGLFRQVIDS